ncbi:dihydroxy-acid dehydratase [Yoonia sp.]|uniref:dihydroxy-acid dehydratase n=1 Tax=Yoonia sp. TaxID=2212373 RepID=UPI001A0AED8B|nr:dihydroxy-acid dehydratase [Yoonia sp.]MBE0412008.1 dihydroxy-acid dehydratase [Yoonia sp.]
MWRYGCAGLALLAVTACLSAPPVQSIALLGGEIVVTPPAGYCVDPSAGRAADGFAVIAACASLSEEGALPSVIGVATVQVGPPNSGIAYGEESGLRDLLVSDAGAKLLSATGNGDTITVVGSQVSGRVVSVHFNDIGPPPLTGLQSEEWRAFLNMNGRLVTVAVRGPESAPLTDGTGAWLLNMMVKSLLTTVNDAADKA